MAEKELAIIQGRCMDIFSICVEEVQGLIEF